MWKPAFWIWIKLFVFFPQLVWNKRRQTIHFIAFTRFRYIDLLLWFVLFCIFSRSIISLNLNQNRVTLNKAFYLFSFILKVRFSLVSLENFDHTFLFVSLHRCVRFFSLVFSQMCALITIINVIWNCFHTNTSTFYLLAFLNGKFFLLLLKFRQ